MRTRALVLGFALIGFGCAGKPPAAAGPASAATPATTVATEPAPDLSPVATPQDLVLIGRVARPRVLVDTLAGWLGMPARLSDMLPPELKSVEPVVAWNAPIEICAVLDQHATSDVAPPLVVASLGLTSVDAALDFAHERGLSPTRVAPSVYRLPVDDDVICAIAASVGAAPARLICGDEWQQVEELLPYATRGLPSENLGTDDVHFELRAAPLQRRYAQKIAGLRLLTGLLLRQLQTDSPRLDRALTDAAYGLADELKAEALDVNRLEIAARLDEPNHALELRGALAFAKNSSYFVQWMQSVGQRSASAPDAFWQLPRSADHATYSVGSEAKQFEPLTSAGAELADAYLEQQKASAALRRRVRSFMDGIPRVLKGGSVYSSAAPPLGKDAGVIERVHHGIGWQIGVALELRADLLNQLLTDAEAVLADRDTARILKQRLELQASQIPKLRHRVQRVNGFAARGTVFTLTAPPSLFDHAHGDGKPTKGEKPVVVASLLFVPDGERTWFSLATDEKTALAQLEAARAGKEGQLKEIAELQPLASGKRVSGGFTTLTSVLRSFEGMLQSRAADAENLLAHAPNHGQTPQLVSAEVLPSGAGSQVRVSWRLPEGSFQDLGAMLQLLLVAGQ